MNYLTTLADFAYAEDVPEPSEWPTTGEDEDWGDPVVEPMKGVKLA